MRFKYSDDGYIPVVDITPAEAFGEIKYLTTPGNNPVTQEAINALIDAMADVDENDLILLTGDTLLCSIALGEMAAIFGKVRLLRWHNREASYAVEEWSWPLVEYADA
jgi:hypothetical protein